MGAWMLTALGTFAASLGLTAVVRSLARRWGIVDRPDGRRKLHARPIPLWGGVAVYVAAVLGLLAAGLGGNGASAAFRELAAAWVIAAGCVCLVGGIDDRFDLPARLKLVLQVVSVLPIVVMGHYVDRVVAFGVPIELGWLGIPLTVLWLVGCINALNLIDGMDGLASIVGLSAMAMMGVIAASEGHAHVALLASVLAASLLGFLFYNLPPASVFLGDSGSMVIGLSLGLLGIQGAMKTSATLAVTAPAVVMMLPMLDIAAAVVRRKLTGRRFDAPDRLHIHHRLLDRGWTPWQVLCLIGAVCLTTGAAATAATIFRRDALAWITAITLVVLMVRLRLFGYEEFAMVKGAVLRAVRLLVSGQWSVVRRRKSELGSRTIGRLVWPFHASDLPLPPSAFPLPTPVLWDLLLHDVRAQGVRQVELRWQRDDVCRRLRWIDPASPTSETLRWSVSVSLPGEGGAVCELRAAAGRVAAETEIAKLTLLLKTFGGHFAGNPDSLFGAPLPQEDSAQPEPRRRAA